MNSELKQITLDEFYDLPKTKIIKGKDEKGFVKNEIEYPNPEVGRTYRNPNVLPTSSRTVNLTTIIGMDRSPHPEFPMTGPRIIKKLHIEERRVYVKKEDT